MIFPPAPPYCDYCEGDAPPGVGPRFGRRGCPKHDPALRSEAYRAAAEARTHVFDALRALADDKKGDAKTALLKAHFLLRELAEDAAVRDGLESAAPALAASFEEKASGVGNESDAGAAGHPARAPGYRPVPPAPHPDSLPPLSGRKPNPELAGVGEARPAEPPSQDQVSAAAPRVTHGRHCSCSACAREDWSRTTGPCGMHGADCPREYAPITASEASAPLAALPQWGQPYTDALQAECGRLREQLDAARQALDWIEAEPEDALKVQARARAALGVVGEVPAED